MGGASLLNPTPVRASAPGWRSAVQRALLSRWSKPLLWLACLLPLAWLLTGALRETLGANPAEALIRATGDWTLRGLCLTLAITPLRVMLGLPALLRFRRLLGVFSYVYALLHLLCYAGFDMQLDLGDIGRDVLKRPLIFVGLAAVLLMTPLALTSFNAAIRALGGRHWQRLHRLVYGVILLGLLHFFWMRAGKHNFAEVAVYAALAAVLLGWRVQRALRQRWLSARQP